MQTKNTIPLSFLFYIIIQCKNILSHPGFSMILILTNKLYILHVNTLVFRIQSPNHTLQQMQHIYTNP